jgi:hypothetical protein
MTTAPFFPAPGGRKSVQWQAASHVPMARPQPDQPWHKPTLFPPSAQRRKQNSYQSKKSFAVLEESCPGERERGGREGWWSFFSAISLTLPYHRLYGAKDFMEPLGKRAPHFPCSWRGVAWRGVVVWQQQRKGELQSHCQERLKERRKASSVTRKASGTECSFAPSAVRFLRPSEQEPGSRQRPSQPLFLSSWGALSLFGLPSHAKNRSLASFRFALLLFRVWSEPVR